MKILKEYNSVLLVLILGFGVITNTIAEEFIEDFKINSSAQTKSFGQFVAISGDNIAVSQFNPYSAGLDEVYMYEKSGEVWNELTILTEDYVGEWLGSVTRLSISGDTAAVANAEYVYIYTKEITGWERQQKITIPLPSEYVNSVSMSGDLLAMGASYTTSGGVPYAGRVYIYRLVAGVWTLEDTLVPNDVHNYHYFGEEVSLSGDTLAVGVRLDGWLEDGTYALSNAGAVYVFKRNSTNMTWSQEAKLRAPDPEASAVLGYSVSLSGDTILAGSPSRSGSVIGDRAGAAYIFTRTNDVWSAGVRLQGSDTGIVVTGADSSIHCTSASTDGFGRSVALSANTALINEFCYESFKSGLVYVYEKSGDSWAEQDILLTTDSEDIRYNYASRNTSLAISGGNAVIGSANSNNRQGAAYTYELTPPSPSVNIQNIIDSILNDPELELLHIGSIVAPLQNAVVLLNDGKDQNDSAVCGKLNAFINAIDGNRDILSESQSADLMQEAAVIRESLGC